MAILSLFLLWLSGAIVGWQLPAHHIFWYIGIIMMGVAPVIAWMGTPWVGGTLWYVPQIFTVALVVSLLLTLNVMFPAVAELVLVPALTTLLAWQEMQVRNLRGIRLWSILASVMLLGLAVGEWVDLYVLPS